MIVASTAAWLITGRVPGIPRQTGQTWVFGGASKQAALQPQNILLCVRTWACTSSPITGSYFTGGVGDAARRVPAPATVSSVMIAYSLKPAADGGASPWPAGSGAPPGTGG